MSAPILPHSFSKADALSDGLLISNKKPNPVFCNFVIRETKMCQCITKLRLTVNVFNACFLPERDYVTFWSLLSKIRLSSGTFVRPTQEVKTFGNISFI